MISKKQLNTLKRVESICDSSGFNYSVDDGFKVYFLVYPRKIDDLIFDYYYSSFIFRKLDSMRNVHFVSVTRFNCSDNFCALFEIC